MHRRTFERLKAEHDTFVAVSLAAMTNRLGLLRHRFDGLLDDLPGGSENLFRKIE